MLKKISNFPFVNSKIFTFVISAILITFYLYQDLTKWSLITYVGAQGGITYIDAYTVLFYAECFSQVGNFVFEYGPICPAWANGSGLLRLLDIIGAGTVDTALFGHVFTYLIIFTFVYFLYLLRAYRYAQIVLFFGLISPPNWLLMERGNFDSLMYLLVFLSAILLFKGFTVTSIILLASSTLMKFYTLPLLVILFLLNKKIYIKVFIIITFLLTVLLVLSDFNKIHNFPHTAGNNHFGMRIIGNYLGKINIKLTMPIANILGLFLLIICVILIFIFLLKFEPELFQKQLFTPVVEVFYLLMSGAFLACFIAGLSVDYRLIFYVVSAPFTIILLKRWHKLFASSLFLISVWFSYPSGIFQTIGDLALEIMVALQIIIFIVLIKGRDTNAHERKLL